MRSLSFFALLVLLPLGCRSHVLSVNLTNISRQPVSTIIVDYPGATFGKEQLGPGKTYQYAIKPQDTGPLKIQFTDATGHIHNYSGPVLHKDEEGTVEVKLDQQNVAAQVQLRGR